MAEGEGESVSNVSIKEEKLSHEEKLQFVTPIARPMATKKLAKRLYKLMKTAFSYKTYLRLGLKGALGRIRRGERGIVVLAGDVTPIDVMCHVPGVCEDKNIPYIYVPAALDVGHALGLRRAVAVVLIREHNDYDSLYKKCKKEIDALAATAFY